MRFLNDVKIKVAQEHTTLEKTQILMHFFRKLFVKIKASIIVQKYVNEL